MGRRKRRRQRGGVVDQAGFPEELKEPDDANPLNKKISRARPICAPGGKKSECMAGGAKVKLEDYAKPVLQDVKNRNVALPQPLRPAAPDYEADWWHPNEPVKGGRRRRRRRRSSRYRRSIYHGKSRRRRSGRRRRRSARRRYRKTRKRFKRF